MPFPSITVLSPSSGRLEDRAFVLLSLALTLSFVENPQRMASLDQLIRKARAAIGPLQIERRVRREVRAILTRAFPV
jgi:hypothetical protein